MILEELRHRHRIFAVALHADVQRFKPEVGEQRVERRHRDPHVADELHPQLDRERGGLEVLHIDQPVIGRIRLREVRELAVAPVEIPLFDDDSADGHGVAVGVFAGRVGHDVRAEVERAAEIGGRKGVVDDERNPGFVGDAGEPLDIEHDEGRIRERLREDRFRVRADCLADRLRVGVGLDEGEFDSELAEGVGEQRDRSAVEARDGDDVVSGPGDVQYGEHRGGLPRADRNGGDAALERGHLLLECVDGRICEPGVEEPFALEVEEVGDALGVVVFVGRALVERQRARFSVAGPVAGLDRLCFNMPVLIHDAVFPSIADADGF